MADATDSTSNYMLVIETYSDNTVIRTAKWNTHADVLEQPISRLSRTKRREICVAAKRFAKLDGMGPRDLIYFAYGYEFLVEHPSHHHKSRIPDAPPPRLIYAVRCSTIPVSYIYFPKPPIDTTAEDKTAELVKTEIRILLKENKFKSENYKFKIVATDEKPILKDFTRIGAIPVLERRLSLSEKITSYPDSNYLDMCYAAKIQGGYEPAPILKDTSIRKPQIYKFPDYLAYCIKCPSSPPMYLHLMNSEYKINVTIVLEDVETESEQMVDGGKSAATTKTVETSKLRSSSQQIL